MKLCIQLCAMFLLVGVAEAGEHKPGDTWLKDNDGRNTCIMEWDKTIRCTEFSATATKKVITEYEDFLQIIAKVEHSEKLKNKAMAEKGVLLKLKDEQGTIIKVQADQIKACEAIVQQQEQLGSTQEQIGQAVEAELKKSQKELAREKRLSRYKSEAFWLGVVGMLWIVNW